MSYANHIWELLEPLGVYQKSGTFQMGEIQTQGAVLDQVDGLLAELEGEMCLATAEDWGLERVASLFRRRPVASTTKRLRAALAALLRIGGDSFTLEAINDTIAGCGVHALVEENGGRAFNGLKMLLYQGIIAYELWTGARVGPELSEVAYVRMKRAMGI